MKQVESCLQKDATAVALVEQSSVLAGRTVAEHFDALQASLNRRRQQIEDQIRAACDLTVTELNARRKNMTIGLSELTASTEAAQRALRQDVRTAAGQQACLSNCKPVVMQRRSIERCLPRPRLKRL